MCIVVLVLVVWKENAGPAVLTWRVVVVRAKTWYNRLWLLFPFLGACRFVVLGRLYAWAHDLPLAPSRPRLL
jgi:hypothetical protein